MINSNVTKYFENGESLIFGTSRGSIESKTRAAIMYIESRGKLLGLIDTATNGKDYRDTKTYCDLGLMEIINTIRGMCQIRVELENIELKIDLSEINNMVEVLSKIDNIEKELYKNDSAIEIFVYPMLSPGTTRLLQKVLNLRKITEELEENVSERIGEEIYGDPEIKGESVEEAEDKLIYSIYSYSNEMGQLSSAIVEDIRKVKHILNEREEEEE